MNNKVSKHAMFNVTDKPLPSLLDLARRYRSLFGWDMPDALVHTEKMTAKIREKYTVAPVVSMQREENNTVFVMQDGTKVRFSSLDECPVFELPSNIRNVGRGKWELIPIPKVCALRARESATATTDYSF